MDESSDPPKLNSLTEILDKLQSENHEGKLQLGELIESFGTRSFGPLLLIFGLISVSPIGAIPAMPLATGALIVLISAQMAVGRTHVWIPKRIAEVSFEGDRLLGLTSRVRPWFVRIDRLTRARLRFLAEGWGGIATAGIIVLLGLTFFPLNMIPMGVFLPALAVCFFALGITTHDGLVILIGIAITLTSAGLGIYFWPF